MIERIIGHFNESARFKLDVAELLAPAIASAADHILQCVMRDGKVLSCGNGGSAANAQHLSSKMVDRFEHDRPGLAAIALTTDCATITAIANGNGFDEVFARQVSALGHPGDVLLAISSDGNSPNIVAAAAAARGRDMTVVALTGRDGGKLAEQLHDNDVLICVPADTAARIHEIHLLTIHCLCDSLDSVLLGVES